MKKIIRRSIYPLIVMGALIFILNGCKKEPKKELPEISVVNISEESDWDYWVVGKNDYYYLKTENSLPKLVLFHSSEADKDYYIFLTEDGMIDKVAVNNYFFVFRNFNGSKVDIGIINPTGETEILRELETNYDLTTISLKNGSLSMAASDVIRLTGRIVGFVPCAMSVAAAFSTIVLTPLAVWSCGNYFLKLSADFETHEFNTTDGFTEFMNTYSGVSIIANCTNPDPTSCAFSAASQGFSQLADYMEQIENEKSGEIQTIETALSKISNTTWDVTLNVDYTDDNYGPFTWYGEVTFNADGTTKYNEPDYPDFRICYGEWRVNWDQIHWDLGFEDQYIFDGTITGNTMNGTWLYFSNCITTWSAVKRE